MDASLHFESQRFGIANDWFFGHAGESERFFESARGGNCESFGGFCHDCGGGRCRSHPHRGRRIFFQLRIPLRGHVMEEGHGQPTGEDQRGTSDEITELHHLLRKGLQYCERFLCLIVRKGNSKDERCDHASRIYTSNTGTQTKPFVRVPAGKNEKRAIFDKFVLTAASRCLQAFSQGWEA